MTQKLAVGDSSSNQPFISIQDYFSITRVTHIEKSVVAYLEVMGAIADNKDTQVKLFHGKIYQKRISGISGNRG